MPRKNKLTIRTGTGTPNASDFVTSEPAWDSSAGKLWIKSAAGVMTAVGASSLEIYDNVAAFPATGSGAVLYLSQDTSRLYRWVSSAYVEAGSIGGGSSGGGAVSSVAGRTGDVTLTSADVSGLGSLATASSVAYSSLTGTPSSFAPSAHKSSHATGGSDALTASDIGAAASSHTHAASAITSGTLSDSLLSGNVVLTTDSRLTNSRTPTGTAGGDLTGSYPNPTIAAGAVVTADLADGAVTRAKLAASESAAVSLYLWSNFR